MKPYRSSLDKENCSPVSSNCVTWQGPNISCINLCKGDSVSDVVYKLATQICDFQKCEFKCENIKLNSEYYDPDRKIYRKFIFRYYKKCCYKFMRKKFY